MNKPKEQRKITREDGFRSYRIFNDTEVSEGGWNGRRWMTSKELKAVEKRWVKHSYETGEQQPDYNDWIAHQCGGCRYFAALDMDYGFCCNEQSPNDGRITFEHGGCVKHSYFEANT